MHVSVSVIDMIHQASLEVTLTVRCNQYNIIHYLSCMDTFKSYAVQCQASEVTPLAAQASETQTSNQD